MKSAYKSLMRIASSEEPSQETLTALSGAILDCLTKKGKQCEQLLLSILTLPEKNVKFPVSALEEILHSSVKSINEMNDTKTSTQSFQRLYSQVSKLPSLLQEQGLIINYLGPLLRKQGRLDQARQLLETGIKLIESNPHLQVDKAATYLNYCAVLSSLSRHHQAYEFALKGLHHVQEKFRSSPNEHNTQVLAIAYFNIACELEHLKKYKKSIIWYNKDIELVKTSDATPELNAILEDCYKNLEKIKKVMRGSSARPPTRPMTKLDMKHQTRNNKDFDVRFPLSEQPTTFEELRQRLEFSKKIEKFRGPSIKESSSVDMILQEFKFAPKLSEKKFILKDWIWNNTGEVEVYLKNAKIEVLLLYNNSTYKTQVDRNPILTLESDIKCRVLPNITLKNSVLIMKGPVFRKTCHLSGIAFSIEIYEDEDCKKVLAYNKKSEAFLFNVPKQQLYEDIVKSLSYSNNTMVINKVIPKEKRPQSANQRETSSKKYRNFIQDAFKDKEYYEQMYSNQISKNRNSHKRNTLAEKRNNIEEKKNKVFTLYRVGSARRREDKKTHKKESIMKYPEIQDAKDILDIEDDEYFVVNDFPKEKEDVRNLIVKNNARPTTSNEKIEKTPYTVHKLAQNMANREKSRRKNNKNVLDNTRTEINGKEYDIYLTVSNNKLYLLCEDGSQSKWTYVERGYSLQDLLKGLIITENDIYIDYAIVGLPVRKDSSETFKARYSKNPKYSIFISETSDNSIKIDIYYGIDLKSTLIAGKSEMFRKAGDELSMSALAIFIANHMINYDTLQLIEDPGCFNQDEYAAKIQSAFRKSLSIHKLIIETVKEIDRKDFQIKCFLFKNYIKIVANHKALHFSLFIEKNSEKPTVDYVKQDIIPVLYIENGMLHANPAIEISHKLYSDMDLFDSPHEVEQAKSRGLNTNALDHFQASDRYSPLIMSPKFQ